MIFPVWILKSIKNMFGMKYDQRVIIKFLWNEKADARDIIARWQAQFNEHIYQLRTGPILDYRDTARSSRPA
jgi:hypothetical protein